MGGVDRLVREGGDLEEEVMWKEEFDIDARGSSQDLRAQ